MPRFDELKATGLLPSPTGVALAILRLTQREDASILEITRVLQSDPALAGRVLKFANSAFAGSTRPIVAISDAVIHLGLRVVRQLALGFSVLANCRSGPCKRFAYEDFWSRSLATAIAGQTLSLASNLMAPEEVFTCGLLSQVGRLALATIYPEAYSEILGSCGEQTSKDLCRQERQYFAMDHNELTAALLQDWGLPEVCVDMVRYHEDPDGGDLTEGSRAHVLSGLMLVARHMAAICLAEKDQRPCLVPVVLSSGARIHLDPVVLTDLCDRVVGQWQEWGRILEVPTHEVGSFAELLERARELPSPEPTPDAAAGTRPDSLRILAVDADPIALRILEQHLTTAGHAVLTARHGQEALHLVLRTDPQILISDWAMPEMTGLELCKALRQTKTGRQVYVIILTTCEDESRLVEAFEAGADDYLAKPVRPKTLEARIRAARRVIRLQEEVARDKEEIRQYVAELGVANRKLEQASLTDALTSLPNRRYAMARLHQEWASALRSGQPLACMMVDIDHFKHVNDTFGHDVGDAVLKETAAILRASVRAGDVVCRLGGEEFVVICRDTDLQSAGQCAERLCKTVQMGPIHVAGFNRHVTVSIGVAARDETTPHPDALLKAADRAVYVAKQAGRNRVRLAGRFAAKTPVAV